MTAEEITDELRQRLLDRLGEKLKGKSVVDTLVRIQNGKTKNKWIHAKGLFSLGTHLSVELEQGNLEYLPLLREVYEKIGKLIDGGN